MELKCYVYPGWDPQVRPAAPRRQWMDDTPESYAYRCLPLSIANSHGWELLCPASFECNWNGGPAVNDVFVRGAPDTPAHELPVAFFGAGTITFHIYGIFRTSPGYSLWASGPPNSAKDGIAPLSGVIETDWSPYTFTMNWQLTRPNQIVKFEKGEPICFIFPIERAAIEQVKPEFISIEDDPQLKADFEAWVASRNKFLADMKEAPPSEPTKQWQKRYFRGLKPTSECPVENHQSKLRVHGFANEHLTKPNG